MSERKINLSSRERSGLLIGTYWVLQNVPADDAAPERGANE
jgi:hypothetical protein